MLAWTLSSHLDGLIRLTQLGYHKLGLTWKTWRCLKSAWVGNSPLGSVLVKEQVHTSHTYCSVALFLFLKGKNVIQWHRRCIAIPERQHFIYPNYHLWISIHGILTAFILALSTAHSILDTKRQFCLSSYSWWKITWFLFFKWETIASASLPMEIPYFDLGVEVGFWNKSKVKVQRVFARESSRLHFLSEVFFESAVWIFVGRVGSLLSLATVKQQPSIL